MSSKALVGGKVMTTLSDQDGVAVISGLLEGSYRLDAALAGFDVARTVVSVGADGKSIAMQLHVRMLCECVDLPSRVEPRVAVEGHVVDDAGYPLPHAVVHATGASLDETGVADSDGLFEARIARERTVALEVSYPGFRSETVSVSTARPASQRLSIVLHPDVAQALPSIGALERLRTGCVCPGNLFVHKIR